MDKPISQKKKNMKMLYKAMAFATAVVLLLVGYQQINFSASELRVEKGRINTAIVEQASFRDYISVSGSAEPITTIYLDAVVGGRVEEVLIEEGAEVKAGDVILKLSNSDLHLQILNSEAQLAEQINFLRNTRISMEQERLNLRQQLLELKYSLIQRKREYERNQQLIADAVVSQEEFKISQEQYELALQSRDLLLMRQQQDSLFRIAQVEQLELNLHTMQQNIKLVRSKLDDLLVTAPVDGQLGLLNAQVGEAISAGDRIGQLNVLTSYKVRVSIDEHYIHRVKTQLMGFTEKNEVKYGLKVKKVFPEVRDGKFEIEMTFVDKVPEEIRTGETYYIQLELGASEEALIVKRGSFYQSTGGKWVYLLADDEASAHKRDVRIGRQNPSHYEVLEGLSEGDKIITSAYESFGDNERLTIRE